MSQQSENLDFSGLFKLDVLVHLNIVTHSFYEVGLRKFLSFSSNKELIFVYIDSQGERSDQSYDWDFLDNPVYCMCFEPSGTWLLIVSEEKLLLVPYLPLFDSKTNFDLKWSLTSVTVLPLGFIAGPTSVVWWLTKESDNILIIGSKNGTITFYSLESQSIVGDTKVPGEITELQICFDDSLDLLSLLISSSKTQQWKLVLEHRSVGYNWLHQTSAQTPTKKEGFMNYIKQLSKDKITVLMQSASKDDSKSTVEYVLQPTEYLPVFRKGSNNWTLTSQYVNGRHFLTAFELNEGTLILESPEENTPSRTLRPRIKKDEQYVLGLWSQRIIYLLRKNALEVHSASFSVIQGDGTVGSKRDFSELWSAELIGEVHRAYLMSTKDPPTLSGGGWKEPTFLYDLQLPRFNLGPCLVVTSKGAYVLNTVCDPCEWLVGLIMRGGVGAEQSAAALGAPVPVLLRAASDMLLSRGKIAPAQYLYSLSQSQPDGWIARLGVFERLQEVAMYKYTGNAGGLSNACVIIKLLAILLKMSNNAEEGFDWDTKFTTLNHSELSELASITAAIGLWDLLPVFTLHRGFPALMLSALQSRRDVCRGAVNCLLTHKCLTPLLLEENAQWLFHFITGNCDKFDTAILKNLSLWLNPLQDQLRPVMRDLKQGMTTLYTTRLQNLITTFVHVISEIESRDPCPEIHLHITQTAETWKNQFVPRSALSCGLAHWAIVDDGNAKVMMTNTPVNTEMIGRAIDVSCGRHHTLLLTENGIYAAGDNTYGQLGVGTCWPGPIGDAASAGGALLHVNHEWTAPIVAVSAGHYHSAAVDVGGLLYTWGWGVHGQLGLGTIDDQCSPQLVTKFQGRKVLSVGCGACHTVVLMKNGEVWACGAAVFGQLGSGHREKSSLPVRVALSEPVTSIAVGYFHNLALTTKGQLYVWGASPQQVRATNARRSASPTVDPTPDPHLSPQLVPTDNVKGIIVKMAAGWHHSCIISNAGNIYTWGLNFDGQLGSGDRKLISLPTEVRMPSESETPAKSPEKETENVYNRSLVACGGDFTVYIDESGKVWATGNMHLAESHEQEKGNRVIMMKTTKRVIKIPATRTSNKFLFQPIDRVDIMFPFDLEGLDRKPIEPRLNPLNTLKDFESKTWADDIILILKPWINEENLAANLNMAAKLAYHKKGYSECIRLLLDNLKRVQHDEKLYLTHTESEEYEGVNGTNVIAIRKDEQKMVTRKIMSQRTKEISLTILNEEPYPAVDTAMYHSLPCSCDERKYLPKDSVKSIVDVVDRNLSLKAANVIDTCISIFPVESKLWEICFRTSKNFYLENKLSVRELEKVLRKYMESNAATVAAAIICSKDCAQYSEILSPKFYLNVCSQVIDTWG